MKEISVTELEIWKRSDKVFQLIDVRSDEERNECSMGGTHIPMQSIPTRYFEIPKEIPIVVYCRSGGRSASVINWLEAECGLSNLYNLTGGILAWLDYNNT